MAYKTIMVQLDLDAPAGPRLKFAMDLADRFKAHLIGFAAAATRAFVPVDQAAGFVMADILREQTREIEAGLNKLKDEFLSIAGEGDHVSWRGEVGDPTALLVSHGRAADLIVSGSPVKGIAADGDRTVNAGALILSAGRPVLFAADDLAPLRAEKAVVAWKDAREARRAVVDALPLLSGAKEVAVVTIAEGDQKASRESVADVVGFLARHGVKARSDVIGVGGADREQALAEIAHEMSADLLVSGGYGHSRLREWAFGGVTRSLLQDGSLHRLISN